MSRSAVYKYITIHLLLSADSRYITRRGDNLLTAGHSTVNNRVADDYENGIQNCVKCF